MSSRRQVNLALTLLVALVFVSLLLHLIARAEAQPIPEEQWTKEAHLWTARAGVAEAGWPTSSVKRREQVAAWYVLATRWRQMTTRWPALRYVDAVRAYCAGLGQNAVPTKRQLWVRGLFLAKKPKGWPRNASWPKHRRLWFATIERADKWARGELRNPCPGADYFGGLRAGDVPVGDMVRHRCSEQFERAKGNTFYRVK